MVFYYYKFIKISGPHTENAYSLYGNLSNDIT